LHAKPEEEKFFREYAANHDSVFFVNKVKDISSQLDVLSKSMLKMLALAFVAVVAILCFFYKIRVVLKIALVPLLVTLVTTAVLILAKIHISFFPITALVLVFGLGLDYIIYALEGSGQKSSLNSFAILLSFVTTALSFGALALSNFPPVHTLGLTVFVGLFTAVVTAFCVSKT
jgi:predicted exporter